MQIRSRGMVEGMEGEQDAGLPLLRKRVLLTANVL